MNYEWFYGLDEKIEQAFAVRTAVFVDEQGFSQEIDKDEKDAFCWHVVGYINNEPCCTARMFIEDEKNNIWHAGRIAVSKKLRGTGMGRKLIEEIAKHARTLNATKLTLGAQHDKANFYKAVGFVQCGEPFIEADYLHIPMEYDLKDKKC